jgi:hypothetical protein
MDCNICDHISLHFTPKWNCLYALCIQHEFASLVTPWGRVCTGSFHAFQLSSASGPFELFDYLCMDLHWRIVGPDFGCTKYVSDWNKFWEFCNDENVFRLCFLLFFFLRMFLDIEFVETSVMCFLMRNNAFLIWPWTDATSSCYWLPENYPHLCSPFSPCITLQWTYRDGHLINLPWALLVTGDVILIRPGQQVPGNCIPLEVRNSKVIIIGPIVLELFRTSVVQIIMLNF